MYGDKYNYPNPGIQESKMHTRSTPTLCHDPRKHTKSKSPMKLGERIKLMFKEALLYREKCAACGRRVRPAAVIKAACKHKYCPRCLCKMGVVALQNKERFPVRCCSQAIPAERVASAMNSQKGQLYISRAEENAVPPAKRWYCPHTACGQLIPPGHIKTESKFQDCPHCRALICSSCRELAHGDRECAEDPDLVQTLEFARREHWQRCYGCRALVCKTDGCNHMICTLCGTQFCYICGDKYPACSCRSIPAALNNGSQIGGEGELDVATVVAAMEIAEREQAAMVHFNREEHILSLNPPEQS